MTCFLRNYRHAILGLTLVALLAAPLAAGAAPPEPRTASSAAAAGGWPDLLWAPWRALQDLILGTAGANGTEDPPPPPPPPPPEPPEDDDELKPPTTPTCPNSQTPGGCTDPTG